MSFFILEVSQVPNQFEDKLTVLAFEHGSTGVSENLSFNHKVYPEPEIIETEFKTLSMYFDSKPSDLIDFLSKEFPNLILKVTQEENKDWLSEWKKTFKSFQLVNQFWIVPSWEKLERTDIEPIFIDPGMAFGTGTHETTQLCSELIYKTLENETIESLIDVGTGTGILVFVAQKMGVPYVLGTDNDPDAIRVAEENAEINKLEIDFTTDDLPAISGTFDVVVANIIDGVLLKMKHNLIAKSNKYLILSGIIIENDAEFIDGFLKETSLQVIERKQKGEWVSYLLQKLS